jgi:light-regulated signal transduction histidine kinase (bacteriophytochrome)
MVYENLISNAIKYTSKKDHAIIEIGSTSMSETEYELFIRDNGAGFDNAYSDKVFGVFQRLHTADDFEGIGIGLANVKQIIEKHSGSVRAEGKINEGATIYFTLPKV